jgi:hypothetical protein
MTKSRTAPITQRCPTQRPVLTRGAQRGPTFSEVSLPPCWGGCRHTGGGMTSLCGSTSCKTTLIKPLSKGVISTVDTCIPAAMR